MTTKLILKKATRIEGNADIHIEFDETLLAKAKEKATSVKQKLQTIIATVSERWEPAREIEFPEDLKVHFVAYCDSCTEKGFFVFDRSGRLVTRFSVDEFEENIAEMRVDRSKLFVRERFWKGMLVEGLIDAKLTESYIEMTRFPIPDNNMHGDTREYPGLVRAANLIGQLGDPYRIQKCTALFYEFEEIVLNNQLGYKTSGDLRKNHAKFYWGHVNKYIQEAVRYLRVTPTGKKWIANMQANVFGPDHGFGD